MVKFSIVLIRWADAHMGDAGWLDLDEYEDDGESIVETVGFLIPVGEAGSKKDHVTLWQTISDDQGIHAMHIPIGMVREVKVLSENGLESLRHLR